MLSDSYWILESNHGHPQFKWFSCGWLFSYRSSDCWFSFAMYGRSSWVLDVLFTFCPLVVLWVVLWCSMTSWLWTLDHSRNILVNSHCSYGRTCRLEKNLALWCHLHWAQCRTLMCKVPHLMSVTVAVQDRDLSLGLPALRDMDGIGWVAPWPVGHDIMIAEATLLTSWESFDFATAKTSNNSRWTSWLKGTRIFGRLAGISDGVGDKSAKPQMDKD